MEQIKNIRYDDLSSALEGIKRTITTNVLLPISAELMPGISNFVNNVRNAFSDGTLTAAVTGMVSGAVGAVRGIASTAGTVFNSVKTAIENNRPAIDGLVTAFNNAKNAVMNAFSGNGTAVIQTLANA